MIVAVAALVQTPAVRHNLPELLVARHTEADVGVVLDEITLRYLEDKIEV